MRDLNKDAVTRVVEDLEARKIEVVATFDKWVTAMKRAKTVNGVMKAKKELLVGVIENLPLYADACYFCMLNEGCSDCEYTKEHGFCGDDEASFTVIATAWENLQDLIVETYWKEE